MKSELKKYRALSVNVTRDPSGATIDKIGLNVVQAIASSKTRIEECIKHNKTRNKPDLKGNLFRNYARWPSIFPGDASAVAVQISMHISTPSL